MHAEQTQLLFTLLATLLLASGGLAAILALPWRNEDIKAADRAAHVVSATLVSAVARYLSAAPVPVRASYSTSSSRVPRPPAMNSLM